MANLSRDRGQLVLVTAVTIAALLILVAALLSSVVYSENVATRGTTSDDARAAQLYRIAAVEAVDGLAQRANWGGASPDEFRANVTAWSNLQARHAATGGVSTQVSIRSMAEERTVDQNARGQMTNDEGASSWSLVSNESSVSSWSIVVDSSSLATHTSAATTAELETDSFHVVVSNDTTTWRAFIYENGTNVDVRVDENGTLAKPCTVSPDPDGNVTIDFVTRTVGSTSCPELEFETVVGPVFAISHENGDAASGTYELVVPHVSEVYVDVRYTSTDLQYVVRNVSVDAEVAS